MLCKSTPEYSKLLNTTSWSFRNEEFLKNRQSCMLIAKRTLRFTNLNAHRLALLNAPKSSSPKNGICMNHTMPHYLCEDLIDEILVRLPTKSLVRFKSLSKTWCSRISSRKFIRMHTLKSVQTPKDAIFQLYSSGFFYRLAPEKEYTSIKSIDSFLHLHWEIAGSCNGIVCLFFIEEAHPFILWNPSIRRKLIVPFYPSGNSHLLSDSGFYQTGFGFDPINDDYKIVSISYSKYGVAENSFIYFMKTNSWTKIVSPATNDRCLSKSRGCFFHGILHWVVKCMLNDRRHYYIMTFNLHSHVFGIIWMPKQSWVSNQLIIVEGCLGVMSSDSDDCDDSWVWVLREYNDVTSWTKVFSRRGLSFDNDLKSYNPETGMSSKLLVFSKTSFRVDMDMCVESLELLDRETC